MFPLMRGEVVRDPVHGYVFFDDCEKKVINSPFVQRLRRIKQTPGVSYVYPGAEQTRFDHSLGVMHLAGFYTMFVLTKKYDICILPDLIKETLKVQNMKQFNELRRKFEVVKDVWDDVKIARLAGLLHDCGHGPFSHDYEPMLMRKRNFTHEDMTRILVVRAGEYLENYSPFEINKLYSFPDWENVKKIYRSQLSELGLKKGKIDKIVEEYDSEIFGEKYRSEVIVGPFDADTIDFVLRDAHYTGTSEYGSVDVMRLLSNIYEHESTLKPHESILYSLEAFFEARVHMYKAVYYHRTTRSVDRMIQLILEKSDKELGLTDFSLKRLKESYLPLDDYYVFGSLARVAKTEEKVEEETEQAIELYQRLNARNILRVAWPPMREIPAKFELSEKMVTSAEQQIKKDVCRKNKWEETPEDLVVLIDYPELMYVKLNPYMLRVGLSLLTGIKQPYSERPLRELSPIYRVLIDEEESKRFVRVYTVDKYRTDVGKVAKAYFVGEAKRFISA